MNKWTCKSCEAENDADASTCIVCGAKRAVASKEPLLTQSALKETPRYVQKPQPRSAGYGEAELHAIRRLDRRILILRELVVFFAVLEFVLFGFRYTYLPGYNFTVYRNFLGKNGAIEQICSVLLVLITMFPPVFCLIPLPRRRRNLPITVSEFVSILTVIYSLVIWFGNEGSTFVPAAILLASCLSLISVVLLMNVQNKLDDALHERKES
ncbi:MAG: hypothetical protein II117_07840 [Clostridia bacterium]|nr:hypothetical protein [Clostridia bacterium]